MKREDLDPRLMKLEISVKAIGHLLRSFEADYGRNELVKLMNRTGLPLEYFDNSNNWISFDYYLNFLDMLVAFTGDPEIPYKYGLNTIKYADSWGIFKTIFSLMNSPLYMYKSVILFSNRYGKVANNKIKVLNKNKVVIETSYDKGYRQSLNNCRNMQGSYKSIPAFFGLPEADLRELRCAAKGADACVYEITWREKSNKKKNFFSLLFVILTVYFMYFVINRLHIDESIIIKILLCSIPIALYSIGKVIDYKMTLKDNMEVAREQNRATLDSLEKVQEINEELQQKIDRRTEELGITNKKLAETIARIKKTEEELLAAERMAGIGRLAAGVAHEINNPMGAVRNYLQDILEYLPDDDPRRPELLEAEKATKESKILINDLLSFSRSDENLYFVEIDINDVLEKICGRIKQLYSDIKIVKHLSPGLHPIKWDEMQISQALNNILLNACNAIKENGSITVKTSEAPGEIGIEISDNGEIIPEYLINKFFDHDEKEFRWDGRKNLEPAISYGIIRRLNGDINVESSFEKGTTFRITIPFVGNI